MDDKKIPPSKNALQSGAYSRDAVLPWESATDYMKHCAKILADVQPEGEIVVGMTEDFANNRWIRKRTTRMSAIAAWHHPFGKALEGARSWQEVVEIAGKQSAISEPMESLAQSFRQFTRAIEDLAEKVEESDLLEKLQEIADGCSDNWKRLGRIEDGIDQVQDFFHEYSPKRLHKRILLENALDAQGEKMLARIEIEKERHRMRKVQKAEGNSPGKALQEGDEALVSTVAADQSQSGESGGLDLAELDRDDDDWNDRPSPGGADVWEEFKKGKTEGDND